METIWSLVFSWIPDTQLISNLTDILSLILRVLSFIPTPFMILIAFAIIIFIIRIFTL